MYDFIRFVPEEIPELGFKGFVFLLENKKDLEGYCGRLIVASAVDELRKRLKKAKETEIVAVYSEVPSVCREAIMRKKVDLLLDGVGRKLDYATIMLAAEKDVTIELGLSKFLRTKGLKRLKLFEELRNEIRIINKFEVPFVISSAASNVYELRSRKQIEVFFSFFGVDVKKAQNYSERLIRRYYDSNYIMNGFEIERCF